MNVVAFFTGERPLSRLEIDRQTSLEQGGDLTSRASTMSFLLVIRHMTNLTVIATAKSALEIFYKIIVDLVIKQI